MSEIEITIRSIQHYMYCPHRWGLMEIDSAWSENVFVTKANLMHDRVHDPDKNHTTRGKKVYTAIPVYNDLEEYNLYGIVDCLELQKDISGISIDNSTEKYKICIVEYKPTKPKNADYNDDDFMQVYAQKICVDYVFGGNSDAEIYYADVKKRVSLPIKENSNILDKQLKRLLQEMRGYLEKGSIPPILKGQKCNGCSMKDLCMPTIHKINNFRLEVEKIRNAE